VAGPDQFLVFDTTVRRRGRAWRWFVSTTKGVVVMCGSERRRSSATYQARRALFLLLSAGPCRSIRPGKSLERLNRCVPHGADGNSLKNSGVDAGSPQRVEQLAQNKGRTERDLASYMPPLIQECGLPSRGSLSMLGNIACNLHQLQVQVKIFGMSCNF